MTTLGRSAEIVPFANIRRTWGRCFGSVGAVGGDGDEGSYSSVDRRCGGVDVDALRVCGTEHDGRRERVTAMGADIRGGRGRADCDRMAVASVRGVGDPGLYRGRACGDCWEGGRPVGRSRTLAVGAL